MKGMLRRSAARTALHFAAPRVHAGQPDRGERDRQIIRLAEPLDAQVERLRAAQYALAKLDGLQVIDVGAHRHLRAGAPVDVVEQEGRQDALRRGAEIGGGENDHDNRLGKVG